jgi:hypothetical protein
MFQFISLWSYLSSSDLLICGQKIRLNGNRKLFEKTYQTLDRSANITSISISLNLWNLLLKAWLFEIKSLKYLKAYCNEII